jgi:hypothetical protein
MMRAFPTPATTPEVGVVILTGEGRPTPSARAAISACAATAATSATTACRA